MYPTDDFKARGWKDVLTSDFKEPPCLEGDVINALMGRQELVGSRLLNLFMKYEIWRGAGGDRMAYFRGDGWFMAFLTNALDGDGLMSYRGYGKNYAEGYRKMKYLRPFYFYEAAVLVSPWQITTVTDYLQYGAVDFGNPDDWAPVEPLRVGTASPAMVALMNRYRHKPSFVVWGGRLYALVNIHYWLTLEHPELGDDPGCIDPTREIEQELFAFYAAAWNQLQTEVPGATGMRLG